MRLKEMNMALPAALQREQEIADAAVAALQQGRDAVQVVRDTSQIAVAAPAPVPPPPEVPPPQPPAPAPRPDDGWEAKYKTLQGKYNAEVPRLQQQLAAMQRQIEQLTAASASPPPPPPAPQPPQPAATPKEVEDFGAPMIEMVQRHAQAVFTHMAHGVMEKLQQVEGRLKAIEQTATGATTAASQTREEFFFSKLTAEVPDWEQINQNADWLAWLGEIDPVYGLPRQAALEHARNSLNATQAIAVFKAFKDSRPKAPPPPPSALEQQVTPPAGASVPPPTAPAQAGRAVIYTQAFLNKFYREVSEGKWRGREAEAAAIEQDILLAGPQGRIRG